MWLASCKQTGDYAKLLCPSTSHCSTTIVEECSMCRETSECISKKQPKIEDMYQEQRHFVLGIEKSVSYDRQTHRPSSSDWHRVPIKLFKISTTVNEQQQTMSMIEYLLNEYLLKTTDTTWNQAGPRALKDTGRPEFDRSTPNRIDVGSLHTKVRRTFRSTGGRNGSEMQPPMQVTPIHGPIWLMNLRRCSREYKEIWKSTEITSRSRHWNKRLGDIEALKAFV